jgi:hypothetical protein
MSPPVEARTKTMANMAMAQAVLEHANQFYDVGCWYVVAECWDVFSVLEELDQQEMRTRVPFELEVSAISHFAKIIAIDATLN